MITLTQPLTLSIVHLLTHTYTHSARAHAHLITGNCEKSSSKRSYYPSRKAFMCFTESRTSGMFVVTEDVQNKPTASFVLSLIGAVFGLLLSSVAIGLGESIPGLNVLGLWILICSIIIAISAAKLNSDPWEHTRWGAITLIFSIISFNLLALIGGILALAYKPIALTPPQQPQTTLIKEVIVKTRCRYCGTPYDETLDKCPYCGARN